MKTYVSSLTFVLALLVGAVVFGAQPQPTLIDFARKGDLEGMKRRLAKGDKVDETTLMFAYKAPGETSLQYAVQQGRTDMVKLLIEHRANVNLAHLGSTPLTQAARDNRKEIATLLLNAGANPNRGHSSVRSEFPLYAAIYNEHFEMADLLIARGAKVGYPLFMDLVELWPTKPEKLTREVEYLIKKGFDVKKPHEVDSLGTDYPIHLAARAAQPHLIKLLIAKGVDVNVVGEAGRRALPTAAWRGDREIAEMLIAAGADVNAGNSLADALVQGHFGIAELLVKNKAQPTIFGYRLVLGTKTPEVRKRAVEFLLAHGLDRQEMNALIAIAEEHERPDIVEYLRSRKAKK